MLRKFLSDIAFMQVLNLLVKPIWILVIDRAVQEALPAETYGNYFALLNGTMIFFILLDLGLNGFNTTQVSRDEKKIHQLTGNILGLKILLSVVYGLVVFAVGAALGYNSVEFSLLLWLTILQIITSFNQYLRTIVASLQRFKWDGIFMVTDRIVTIVICAVLLWGGLSGLELDITRFVFAQIIGVLTVLIMLLVFLRSYLKKIQLSFNLNRIAPILKKSWPFAVLVALMGMYNYLDGVMLKQLAGDQEAGVYAMGYRLFYALLMFAQIFSGVLLPLFSKNITDHRMIDQISSYTFRLLFFIGVVVALGSFSYHDEIIDILYHTKSTEHAANVFSILMFGFIGSAFILVYGTLLTAGMHLKQLNRLAFLTLLLNLGLNFYLIPEYGALGAGYATVASQIIFGVSCFFISHRQFELKWDRIALIRQLIAIILLFVVINQTKQYSSSLYVHLVMITLTVLLSAYLFKLVEKKHLKTLLNK